ncbi:flagellar biosynthesis regulator FlhF [Piscirickettsia salmonis]|uniref:hypothetical protein n=1 Tax=Piscirickettsia salmonis TaxID=1238 RepID=UPI00050A0FD5|nr:flagellar biosynthesis regulator FlhF [Piscirickettsia salmonis]QGO30733.1 flagellar biosynthesis regulator FlhF [Piscirickettsia salmonis]QGP46618.1 flagellar biosynthesis regulator FlhF [Piscirickettsia salmonis]
MKIKRFFAEDMRSALKQVKEALGPDAVILSNRRVDGGVELVTAVDYDPTAIRKIAYAPDSSQVSQKKEQQKNNHSRQLLNDHPLLKEAAAKIKNKPIKELDTFAVSSKSNNKSKASNSKTHAQMEKLSTPHK